MAISWKNGANGKTRVQVEAADAGQSKTFTLNALLFTVEGIAAYLDESTAAIPCRSDAVQDGGVKHSRKASFNPADLASEVRAAAHVEAK